MKHEQAMQSEINTIFLIGKTLTLTLKYKYAKSRQKCEWVDNRRGTGGPEETAKETGQEHHACISYI